MGFKSQRKYFFILATILVNFYYQASAYNIGLLIVATGRYTDFVPPLIRSAQTYFCTSHTVTYFVFTDGVISQADNIVRIEQKRLGWPYDTLMRFGMYASSRDILQSMDYVYACDADMLFTNVVGDEILGDLVATLHPGYVGTKGTYETNVRSLAYIPLGQGSCYFAGGFHGGRTEMYLEMADTIAQNVITDLTNGIIALWHDESHLNRYFVTHPPSLILSPSYCYWQGKMLPYPQKLIALNKDHKKYRA